MSELKTLKDLETDSANLFCDDAVQAKVLRQEAIKWIKYLKPKDCNNLAPDKFESFINEETCTFTEVIEFLKHFFNITDEELKDKS